MTKQHKEKSKERKTKYALITTVSTFHMQYFVPLEEGQTLEDAQNTVLQGRRDDFHQVHLGEMILSAHEMGEKKLLKKVKKHMYGAWTDEAVLQAFDRTVDTTLKPSFKTSNTPTPSKKKRGDKNEENRKQLKTSKKNQFSGTDENPKTRALATKKAAK